MRLERPSIGFCLISPPLGFFLFPLPVVYPQPCVYTTTPNCFLLLCKKQPQISMVSCCIINYLKVQSNDHFICSWFSWAGFRQGIVGMLGVIKELELWLGCCDWHHMSLSAGFLSWLSPMWSLCVTNLDFFIAQWSQGGWVSHTAGYP